MKKNEIIAKLKEVLPENNKSGIHSEKINEILMLIRHLVKVILNSYHIAYCFSLHI